MTPPLGAGRGRGARPGPIPAHVCLLVAPEAKPREPRTGEQGGLLDSGPAGEADWRPATPRGVRGRPRQEGTPREPGGREEPPAEGTSGRQGGSALGNRATVDVLSAVPGPPGLFPKLGWARGAVEELSRFNGGAKLRGRRGGGGPRRDRGVAGGGSSRLGRK